MAQKRQLEDALAAVERAGSGNTFEPIRHYLQLVRLGRIPVLVPHSDSSQRALSLVIWPGARAEGAGLGARHAAGRAASPDVQAAAARGRECACMHHMDALFCLS
jgi:hypothetical protein